MVSNVAISIGHIGQQCKQAVEQIQVSINGSQGNIVYITQLYIGMNLAVHQIGHLALILR